MPTLSIQLPGLPPVSHVLKDETITIGRMKGNTIVIEDSSISLMHAKITRKNGDFLLKDLNSTNGTSVNGQPIGEVTLRDLDRVRFAEITCQFISDAPVLGDQPTQTVAAPAPIPVNRPAAAQPSAAAPLPVRSPSPVQTVRASAIAAPMPSQTKARSFSLWALRYAGALLVVGVVSVAAWRFFQLNREGSSKSENAPTGTLQVAAKPLVGSKSQPTPRDEKRSPESGNGLSNRVSEVADTVPPTQNAVAEQKTESATESLPQLVDALKSQDVTERQRAAAALHSMGAKAKDAIPALREALKDQDQDVQMWSALALVNNQEFDKTVVPVLVRALQKDNPVLRQVACLSLGLIPYLESEKETVIPPLTQTAEKDANEDVRKAALSALSIIAPESVGKRAAK